jgi:hypothetical protein
LSAFWHHSALCAHTGSVRWHDDQVPERIWPSAGKPCSRGRPTDSRATPAHGRWTGPREIALFVAGYLTYFGVRAVAQGSAPRAVANAAKVVRVERLLGLQWERSLQSVIVDDRALVRWRTGSTSSGTGRC